MILVLAIFTGCKGMGGLIKVVAVAAYVTVRVAVAAAASSKHSDSSSSSSSSSSTTSPPDECECAPVEHGKTWCDSNYQCVLSCNVEEGWVYRDGICVPAS